MRRRVLNKPLLLSSLTRALKKSTALNCTLQHSTALNSTQPRPSTQRTRFPSAATVPSSAQGIHPPLPHAPSNSAAQGSIDSSQLLRALILCSLTLPRTVRGRGLRYQSPAVVRHTPLVPMLPLRRILSHGDRGGAQPFFCLATIGTWRGCLMYFAPPKVKTPPYRAAPPGTKLRIFCTLFQNT